MARKFQVKWDDTYLGHFPAANAKEAARKAISKYGYGYKTFTGDYLIVTKGNLNPGESVEINAIEIAYINLSETASQYGSTMEQFAEAMSKVVAAIPNTLELLEDN